MFSLTQLKDHGTSWDDPNSELLNLYGPHKLRDRFPTKLDALKESRNYTNKFQNIIFIENLALELNGDTAVNMWIPSVIFGKTIHLDDVIVVANKNDAERVARMHLKKGKIYGTSSNLLGDGVLSTSNLESWEEQRTTLVESFLPLSSLAKVAPISVKRAKYAVYDKVRSLQKTGEPINMFEVYLHEAMAQLHLALLGIPEQLSEENNVRLRSAFSEVLSGTAGGVERWKENRNFTREFSKKILDSGRNEKGDPTKAAPYRASIVGCPVFGPVGAKLIENTPSSAIDPISVQRDTATTISFAGFDTTANLMTWLTFEMCRRPELQTRLQKEIDEVFDGLNGRDLAYEDLTKFSFLTKVINETLRLWTSVPNGTFRETLIEDTIEGIDGKPVALKPGTQLWIPSWLLHRSEKLWGPDVLDFNPDRKWLPEESWYGKTFSGTNPSSYRYCPFTFPPRGCLGLNFAQMESRIILTYMFREYSFSFAEPTKSRAALAHTRDHFLGVNKGTMGPDGGLWVFATPRRNSKM